MSKCDFCGKTILFGGVRDGGYRFCNRECHQHGLLISISAEVPEDVFREQLDQVHQGPCPHCGGPGPVDVHTSWVVMSVLVVTFIQTKPKVCCCSCGAKSKLGAAALSFLVGWWGIPVGIMATPVLVVRNLIGLFSSPDPTKPSGHLENTVRVDLGARIAQSSRAEDTAAEE